MFTPSLLLAALLSPGPLAADSPAGGEPASSEPAGPGGEAGATDQAGGEPSGDEEAPSQEAGANPPGSAAGEAPLDESGPASGADQGLLEVLLALFDVQEPSAAAAARRLGELGDPRGLGPLEFAVLHASEPVAAESARSLGRFPESERFLAEAATRPLPEPVRLALVDALGAVQAPEAGEALASLCTDRRVPRKVRSHALEVLRERYPEQASALGELVVEDGSAWRALGGAWGLGTLMGAAGHFGQAELTGLGVVTGAVAGGTFGYVWGRVHPLESGPAGFQATAGTFGSLGGLFVGSALAEHEDDGGWLGAAGGEVVGYALGGLLRERWPGNGRDVLEASGLALATAMGVGSGADFLLLGDPSVWEVEDSSQDSVVYENTDLERRRDLASLGLGVAWWLGAAAGDLLAPRVDVQPAGLGAIGLGATYGMLAGGIVPVGGWDRRGLPYAGLGLGTVAAFAAQTLVEPHGDEVFGGFAGLGYGSLVGLGAAALARPEGDPDWEGGIALAGGTLGLGLGSWLAARNPAGVSADDAVLSGAATAWCTYITGAALDIADAYDQDHGLVALLPAGLGGGLAVASPALEVPFGSTLAASSIGLWGVYTGLSIGTLADLQDDELVAAGLAGAGVGLAAGAMLLSPAVGLEPPVVGLADAGGVLGGSTFALVTSFVTDDTDTILETSLGGSAMGALGGALVARILLRRDATALSPPAAPRLGRALAGWRIEPAALPGEAGPGYGLVLSRQGW